MVQEFKLNNNNNIQSQELATLYCEFNAMKNIVIRLLEDAQILSDIRLDNNMIETFNKRTVSLYRQMIEKQTDIVKNLPEYQGQPIHAIEYSFYDNALIVDWGDVQ